MIASFHFATNSLDYIAQASAARIVDCLVEGTLVVAFTTLALRLTRRWNSGTRFAVWFCVLTTMAALPLLGTMLSGNWWVTSVGTSPAALTRPEIMLPGSWATWLFGAWAGIAAFGLARVGVGLWRLRGLRESCIGVDSTLLDSELRETLTRFSLSHGNTRVPALCVSERVSVPTAIGFLRPAVVIPAWLMKELSTAELKQILLHELAHLQRWDDWTNLAQKILKALLFFHPAVWWVEKQLSLEREMACDDAVVAETANPRAYAECLTHLAEKSFVRRSLALAQAALGRIRQTSLRVAQILDPNQPRAQRYGWWPAMMLVLGFAVACATGMSRTPRLVGFENSLPTSTLIANLSSSPKISSPSFSSSSSSDQPVQAVTARSETDLRPIMASFHPPQPRMIPAKKTSQNVELAREASPQSGPRGAEIIYAKAPAPSSVPSDLFYLADFVPGRFATDLRPISETVFVVVESQGLGFRVGSTPAMAYRISVWRVVIQQPAGDSNTNPIPRKET